jgi:hypothetical protein
MAQSKSRKLSRAAKKILSASNEMESDDDFVDFISRQPDDLAEEVLLYRTYQAREQQLLDLANLRDDGMVWFSRRWGCRVRSELKGDIFILQRELRRIWRRPPADIVESILDKWLAWRPSPGHWKRYRTMKDLMPITGNHRSYLAFHSSIEAARLVPDFGSFRAMLVQGVLEHWRHFKYCVNRGCVARYFLAKRTDQTICNAEACKAEKQRQHALKWWRENRSKKKKSSRILK